MADSEVKEIKSCDVEDHVAALWVIGCRRVCSVYAHTTAKGHTINEMAIQQRVRYISVS